MDHAIVLYMNDEKKAMVNGITRCSKSCQKYLLRFVRC